MKYHDITHDDMLNGDGLRVVLWLSGCEIKCDKCQNPQTWDPDYGLDFDKAAKDEIYSSLRKDHIRGITFTGGHPLHQRNIREVDSLMIDIKLRFPYKDIWLYTGLQFEDIVYAWWKLYTNNQKNGFVINQEIYRSDEYIRYNIIEKCNVVVDGPYIHKLNNPTLHWRGSSNQKVIDVKKTFENITSCLLHKFKNNLNPDKAVSISKNEIIDKIEIYPESI